MTTKCSLNFPKNGFEKPSVGRAVNFSKGVLRRLDVLVVTRKASRFSM